VSPTTQKSATVGQLLDLLRDTVQIEVLTGDLGLGRAVTTADISSPGLALAGYVARFPAHRLQVLGETEITYLATLSLEQRLENLRTFFSFELPCVFVTKGQALPEGLMEAAVEGGVPLARTPLKTAEFYRLAKPVLEAEFAPSTTLHGSLADVFGVGLLFTGKSGIGKSECVLDLVERGHRFVADDVVIVTRRGNDILIGKGHELQRHHMEIRGIGLIHIPSIFGVRAMRQQKRVEVVVHLEEWNQDAVVDRTGLDRLKTTILGVEIPRITIPLNPGKNITVIAEVIALNHLLEFAGHSQAEAFNAALIARMRTAATLKQYLQEDHE
jgi:HPr kinase/phosphorylase